MTSVASDLGTREAIRWFDFVELYQAGRRPVRVDAATGLR